MLPHLPPDEIHTLLTSIDIESAARTVTLEREVEPGVTEIHRGSVELLDATGVTVRLEAGDHLEYVPLSEVVRFTIEPAPSGGDPEPPDPIYGDALV